MIHNAENSVTRGLDHPVPHPTELSRILALLRQRMSVLAAKYSVSYLAVFGSVARGEATADSDIDILVEFSRCPGLFGFLDLERELSEFVGRRVDLVERKALKPAIAKRVLPEIMAV